MGAFGTAIYSDDLAADIRRSYNALLSIGKSNHQAEALLMEYYHEILDKEDIDEPVFWFALSLSEWKSGRLSEYVKEKALYFLETGSDLARWNTEGNQKDYNKRAQVLMDLKSTLLSPVPPEKKIRKPTVHHCPWPVGSLLAYRISTSKKVAENSPCFMKYALIRIIKIERNPVTHLAPTEYYNELMYVGLYGWIGDELPSADIVDGLEYIPIAIYDLRPRRSIDLSALGQLPDDMKNTIEDAMQSLSKKRIDTCIILDWIPSKDWSTKGNPPDNITYLGRDAAYETTIPDFFTDSLNSFSISNLSSFDSTIARRLEKYCR